MVLSVALPPCRPSPGEKAAFDGHSLSTTFPWPNPSAAPLATRTCALKLALRGGAWISEEETVQETGAPVRAEASNMPLSAQGMDDTLLDDFVEKCAAAALQDGGVGGGVLAGDGALGEMPYDEFVWSRQFAEQGFDPLFMLGMTEEQAEAARVEWVSRIMDGDEDVDQLSEVRQSANVDVLHAHRPQSHGHACTHARARAHSTIGTKATAW